ncbi:hypothetical protein J7L68_09215 [bacterium]|nr:hypothetical protein [bacterium]
MKMSKKKKIERFDKKYRDKGGFKKFLDMVKNLCTLEEIGKHFGYSRQNTAGLYRSFFNDGYGGIQRLRRERQIKEQFKSYEDLQNLKDKLIAKKKFRSAKKIEYIILVKKISEEMGYDVQIRRKRSGALEVFINNYKTTISGTQTQTIYHIPKDHPPSVYFRFAVPSKPTDFCIFIIEVDKSYTYHIIPFDEIKHLTLITLKESYVRERKTRGNKSSKYAIYRNRWDLLAKPKNVLK